MCPSSFAQKYRFSVTSGTKSRISKKVLPIVLRVVHLFISLTHGKHTKAPRLVFSSWTEVELHTQPTRVRNPSSIHQQSQGVALCLRDGGNATASQPRHSLRCYRIILISALIMNYFDTLTKKTKRAIAYAVIFATLAAFVLVMDFALWLINTTFA